MLYNKSIDPSRKDKALMSIIKDYLEIYFDGFKLEEIKLDDVLHSYSIGECIDVSIGKYSNRFYYVLREKPMLIEKQRELVHEIIEKNIIDWLSQYPSQTGFTRLVDPETYVKLKMESGLGLLLPLVLDPFIEDIYLTRSKRKVYVVHNLLSWVGWIETNIIVESPAVDRLVLAISRRIGKHISVVNPLAEGTLANSLRVSLVYGDSISPMGSSIVIRKRSGREWTITRLIAEGTLSPVIASYLWLVLERKGWIIIAGHVGAGKTSLLQGLLSLIPPYKKIISIEDTPELSSSTGLWEPLVEKAEVFANTPNIDSYTLLKFALRRRPDYVVIGEVRGVEARLLVQASRLGHGVINTIHADSPESVLKRLISPPISIARNLLNNIWTIVMIGMDPGGKRRALSVSEILDDLSITNLCTKRLDECSSEEVAHGSHKLRRYYSAIQLTREVENRSSFLKRLVESKIYGLDEIAEKLVEFYNPSESS